MTFWPFRRRERPALFHPSPETPFTNSLAASARSRCRPASDPAGSGRMGAGAPRQTSVGPSGNYPARVRTNIRKGVAKTDRRCVRTTPPERPHPQAEKARSGPRLGEEDAQWAIAIASYPGLTDKEKLLGVLLIMVYYNDYSGQCNPAAQTLAANTVSTERWIRRTLAKYKERGLLNYEPNKGGIDYRTGKGITNNYQYVMPPWPTLSPQTGLNPVQPDRVKPPTLPGQNTNPVQPEPPNPVCTGPRTLSP